MLAIPVQAKRLALVMGNDNYVSVSKLQKAGNDADAMARELKSAGFAVTSYRDLNYRAMLKAIDAFAESITGGDEVVVFYAGHGVQIKTGAYLLPVDIEAENESQVERTSYGLNDLTERLAEAKPAFTLVMVDACRDNPMKVKGRAVGNARGLNALEPPKGQMVVYSASRGQQALDRLSDNDSNPNGVFTREFITRMRTPGVKIEDLMRDVQDSVESLAKSVRHEQRPAVYNEARGNFYFYGPTTVQVQQGADDSEAQTWAAAQAVNSATAYQAYLDAYPKGKYVVAAKIKLDSFKKTPEQSPSDTEAGLWAEVKTTGTREYLQTYIDQYPKGKYVALARLELKKLDDADRAKNAKLAMEEQQAQRVEQAVWDEAVIGNTANSYSAYLEKYPSGRFSPQAKAAKLGADVRVAAAKRVEEEKRQITLENQRQESRKGQGQIVADNRRRLALVIGNDSYSSMPRLSNAVNDAKLMTDALRQANFEVMSYNNLDKRRMQEALRSFTGKLGRDDVGLFYFSGHGVQVDGKDFLIPIAENIKKSADIPFEGIDANRVMALMQTGNNSLNVVLLDTSRSSLLNGGEMTRSKTATEVPMGFIVGYAASPGKPASDGDGANSPFTRNLIRLMPRKGLKIEDAFEEVRMAVSRETNGEQVPQMISKLVGDFYFQP